MKILTNAFSCALAVMALFAACEQETYETGTGKYSLLQAELVEAYSDAKHQVNYVVTDEGVRLPLSKPHTAKWIDKSDTIYRAALYYNKVEEQAEVVQLVQVSTPHIIPVDSFKSGVKTDPIKFESIWMSKNRHYLNLGAYLMMGTKEEMAEPQVLGIVADSIALHADSTQTLYLRLYHDQGGVPEYYSQHIYFSVPLMHVKTDSVRLTVNTYKGIVTRCFSMK
jgi:hypothetical protein